MKDGGTSFDPALGYGWDAEVGTRVRGSGVQKELDNRALAVWVRRGGAWRLLALQSGAVPKP